MAGFGASGRNGGWCSALFPTLAAARREDAGRCAMRRRSTRSARWPPPRGSTATSPRAAPSSLAPAQGRSSRGARAGVRTTRLLSAGRGRPSGCGRPRTLGATYTPDCAAIHPGRLVRGPGRRSSSAAGSPSTSGPRRSRSSPGVVRTARGAVRAPYVVRATEGFTPRLPGLARAVVPVYSLIIATEPLGPGGLGRDRAGAAGDVLRPPAPDHLRAADRGRPARLRRPRGAVPPAVADLPGLRPRPAGLRRAARDAARPVPGAARAPGSRTPGAGRSASRATGAPRSGWTAATGLAWAGGYVGDGVSTTNLAGRTLRDLVLDRSTELTALPWVGHRSPAWEPEPLRWLGINAGLRAMTLADVEESVTGRPSVIARVMAPLIGGHSASRAGSEHDGHVQKRALVRRPGPRLDEGLLTHLERHAGRRREGAAPVARLRRRAPGRGVGALRGRRPPTTAPTRSSSRTPRSCTATSPSSPDPVPTSASPRPRAPRPRCPGWATGSRTSRSPAPSTAATCSSTAARSGSGSAAAPTRPASTSCAPSSSRSAPPWSAFRSPRCCTSSPQSPRCPTAR